MPFQIEAFKFPKKLAKKWWCVVITLSLFENDFEPI
jgi:hypothetical protein